MNSTIYLRLRYRVQILPGKQIFVKDIAKVVGNDELKKAVENVAISTKDMTNKKVFVIDISTVIEAITKQFPNIVLDTFGPVQTLMDVVRKPRKYSILLFIAVWILLFIGAGLTIMNFHEDVSMRALHERLYYLITGTNNSHPLIMQIPYSFGLGLGMILFFNHIFKKRFNDEPSPLEIEMFNYQLDLEQYIIMNENKQSTTLVEEDD